MNVLSTFLLISGPPGVGTAPPGLPGDRRPPAPRAPQPEPGRSGGARVPGGPHTGRARGSCAVTPAREGRSPAGAGGRMLLTDAARVNLTLSPSSSRSQSRWQIPLLPHFPSLLVSHRHPRVPIVRKTPLLSCLACPCPANCPQGESCAHCPRGHPGLDAAATHLLSCRTTPRLAPAFLQHLLHSAAREVLLEHTSDATFLLRTLLWSCSHWE